MKRNMVVLLTLALVGCQKETPTTAEQTTLPEVPHVVVTQANYTESDLRSRVPDTTLKNTCCAMYTSSLTDSSKRSVARVIVEKARQLNQDTATVSHCLTATGQLVTGVVSVPYFAERARYQSIECWIFEFAWGSTPQDLGHYRCFVMNISTQDTLLYITCR
jgi:hypothetical protein